MPHTIDAERFKSAMRNMASGVTLITGMADGERGGMTATAVCSLSAVPPQVLVCVNRQASTHALISAGGRFCVNVLAAGQSAMASTFASAMAWEQRFASGAWTTLATGAPVLADALAAFDCEVAEEIQAATHTIFIGRVVDVLAAEEDQPLLYYRSHYAGLSACPA
jgi:flavin reductase (DIM6/NTAB) family NADH-FMN oxidoreductase RutF